VQTRFAVRSNQTRGPAENATYPNAPVEDEDDDEDDYQIIERE